MLDRCLFHEGRTSCSGSKMMERNYGRMLLRWVDIDRRMRMRRAAGHSLSIFLFPVSATRFSARNVDRSFCGHCETLILRSSLVPHTVWSSCRARSILFPVSDVLFAPNRFVRLVESGNRLVQFTPFQQRQQGNVARGLFSDSFFKF